MIEYGPECRAVCDPLAEYGPPRGISPERIIATRRVIDALVAMLPPIGSVFPVDERKRWLEAMAAALILGHGFDTKITITVVNDADLCKSTD